MTVALCALAFILSLAGCVLVRRIAVRASLLDKPNERSLHTVPTPRLGGVAIVIAVAMVSVIQALRDQETASLLGVGLAIALVGLIDDLRPISARIRLLLQLAAASALLWVLGVPPLDLISGITLDAPRWLTASVLVVWIVGVLNIYNFMDGMDGLAGTQAVGAAAGCAMVLGGDLRVFAAIVGAASAGFLVKNAPPARIFMGDSGSTFLGFMFAGLGVIGMRHHVSLATIALSLSPFLLDGTFTLFRRALRGEKVWHAHRTHLYQRAVQTELQHRDVLIVYGGWVVIAFVGVALSGVSPIATLVGWGASIAGLIGIIVWVTRRESEQSRATKPADLVVDRPS